MAYIGRDIQYGTLDKQSFTANSSATVFTLNTTVKDAKSLLVSVGGVIQEPDVAYTASGTTLTFSEAPVTGNIVYVIYLGKELIAGATRESITYQSGTGNGSTTPVTLSAAANNAQSIMVMLNGVTQTPETDYTVNGTTLTFNEAVPNGVAILVYHLANQAQAFTVNDASVTDAKIVSLDASKLTGSLPGSMGVNTTTLDQSIASLGLHVGVSENKIAYNLPEAYIDVFQDDSGLLTETDVDRDATYEYVSTATPALGQFVSDANTMLLLHMDDDGLTDSSSYGHTMTKGGSVARSNTQSKFGSYSMNCPGGGSDFLTGPANIYDIGTGDFTLEGWFYWTSFVNNSGMFDFSTWGGDQYSFLVRANADTQGAQPNWEVGIYGGGGSYPDRYAWENTTPRVTTNTWTHCCVERHNGVLRMYKDGVSKAYTPSGNGFTGDYNFGTSGAIRIGKSWWTIHNGFIDEVRFSNIARYQGTNFTPNMSTSLNATGTLISKASTAASTVSTTSGVMLYEDAEGTGTLGTDLKIYFSSDDGANWTEASSYGNSMTFSGDVKMVPLGSTTLTGGTGTAVKMKAEWANQTAGSVGDPGDYGNSYSTGDRSSIITATTDVTFGNGNISNMHNGTKTSFSNYFSGGSQAITSKYMRWQFNEARVVTEARWWNDEGDDGAFGTWKWQGSNDGSNWTDIGADFELNNLQLVGSAPSYQELTTLSGNTTAYTYYQMLGVSGTVSFHSNHLEIEFKCNAINLVPGKVQRLHGWAVNY